MEVHEASTIQRYLTDDEIMQLLGQRLRTIRINKDMTIDNVVLKIGLNRKTILDIENGRNVNMKSFVRYLRGVSALNLLNAAFPYQTIDPLKMITRTKDRTKAYSPRGPRTKNISEQKIQNEEST